MAEVPTSHPHPNHYKQHLSEIEPRPAIFRSWERVRRQRVHWLVECIAETVSPSLVLVQFLSVLIAYSSVFFAIVMQV
jgi:hypothetical protein